MIPSAVDGAVPGRGASVVAVVALALGSLVGPGEARSLAPPTPAVVHIGPPLFLEVDIGERLEVHVFCEQKVIVHWLGHGGEVFTDPIPPTLAAELARRARPILADRMRITVAGEVVPWEVGSVSVPAGFGGENPEPGLEVLLTADLGAVPERVDLVWTRFDGLESPAGLSVPAVFRLDRLVEFAELTEEEPGFVWHAPRSESVPGARAPVLPDSRETWRVSLLTWGLLVAAGTLLALAPRLGRGKPVGFAACALATVLALFLRDVGRVDVAVPWGRVMVPDEARAREVFEELHGGIYLAFSARSEAEIYDLLAACVGPGILDELYADVYESLILRGEGGAVCKIGGVEVLEGEVHLPEGETVVPGWEVVWRWRVHGLVTHWGHVHRRVNEYRARYAVASFDGAWKIAGAETLEHRRIEDGEGGADAGERVPVVEGEGGP